MYSDNFLRGILRETRRVALVGASAKWQRPSFVVMKYLLNKGYQVAPINPGLAGQEILGQRVYADLSELSAPVDLVDIFRNSAAAGEIIDKAIAEKERLGITTVWMQLGVENAEAAARAEAVGLEVVMNRCPKIEFDRLNVTLSSGG